MAALSEEKDTDRLEMQKRHMKLNEFLLKAKLSKELRERVKDYSAFMSRRHEFMSERRLLHQLSPSLRRAVTAQINAAILSKVRAWATAAMLPS